MTTTWSGGSRIFYAALRDISDSVLNGTLVAVDPSIGSRDSMPGYAIFYKGKLQVSGTAAIDFRATSYDRLRLIHNWIRQLVPSPIDVFAVEAIPKPLGHIYTLWAVAATITGTEATHTIEIPIPFWKAYVKDKVGYVKGDEQDAIAMGEAMIAYCREATSATPAA
jgi:hypothetical protein